MKKKILKGIIIFTIVLLTLLTLTSKKDSQENSWTKLPYYTRLYCTTDDVKEKKDDHDTLQGIAQNKNRIKGKITNWNSIKYVYGCMSNDNNTYNENEGKNAYNYSLRQWNVFCDQEDKPDIYCFYEVGDEEECKDDALSYILYNAVSDKTYNIANLEDYYKTEAQKDYWNYKKNKTTTDKVNEYTNLLKNFDPKIEINNGNDGNVTIRVLNCDYESVEFDISLFVNDKPIGGTTKKNMTPKDHVYEIKFPKNNITGKIKVTLTAKFKKYSVKYVKLTNDNHQNLLVVTKIKSEYMTRTDEKEVNVNVKANVRLEKYVSVVQNANNVRKEQTTTTRQDHPVYQKGGFDNIDTEEYDKRDNPVQVEKGDKVIYTIIIHNDDDMDFTTNFFDESGNGLELIKNSIAYVAESPVYNDNGEKIWPNIVEYEYDRNWNINRLKIEKISIKGNSKTYIYLQYEVTDDSASVIQNRAYLGDLYTNNIKVEKIEDICDDSDWIQTKKYSVSLKKYVSKITDKSENVTSITERANAPRNNENLMPENDPSGHNRNTYKKDNPVEVEVGDKVTYTIELKNESDTPVKVTQIYDTFEYTKYDSANRLSCTNRENIKIRNENNVEIGSGKVIEDHWYEEIRKYMDGDRYTNDDRDDINTGLDVWLIELSYNNGQYILGNGTVYIDMEFEVQVNYNYNYKYMDILYNKAGIVQIKNVNNIEVEDSNGIWDNHDIEHIKIKEYRVSLEKYVSKVNDTLITGREGYPIHNNDNNQNTWNEYKYNNVVTVSKGDTVTYTIKVKNDGDTKVTITNIADYFPNGVKYGNTEYKGTTYCTEFNNGQTTNEIDIFDIIDINEITLEPRTSQSFDVHVTVIEPNISVNVMKNVAEITALKNKNNWSVKDATPNNNKDADYIQVSHEEIENKTEYKVEKKWYTNGNERPAQVTVKLLKLNGETEIDLGKECVVLSDANGWTYTWKDLPILDSNWKYVVRELNEAGTDLLPGGGNYNKGIEVQYVDNETSKLTTITNRIEEVPPPPSSDITSYSVTKVWQDDNNKDEGRPREVYVQLYKDSNEYGDKVKLSEGNWTYTWNNLTKYDENGNLIEYIAKELKETTGLFNIKTYTALDDNGKLDDNYTVTYKYEADKTTIYNTHKTKEKSDDFIISGIVWNDMALDKTSKSCNGLKDNKESYLSGITVKLYRVDKGIVATTKTNENGEYRFTNADLDTSLPENERYIKGPKVENTNRWAGNYYSYYVIFEYDGITYTSTTYTRFGTRFGTSDETVYNYSNAREKLNNESFDGNVSKSRTAYNNGFSTINSESGIDYATVNEEGYIPQSKHKYNSSMAMQSSTIKIELENDPTLENNLKHVNLGLKGRDVFDLELTSDVYSTKVTVNGVDGTYNYSNKVTVRRNDCNNYNYREDSANVFYEDNFYKGENYEQKVRSSDITNTTYGNTGLAIEVTYKITVKNASNTKGTATKITNYYDNRYTFKKAYSDSGDLGTTEGGTGTGYKSVEITTPGTQLNQLDTMEIYVVYNLNDAANTLKDVNQLATYNMAEITEYTTSSGEGQTEFTRGLIDKDSAPGSAATEKVRLAPNLIGNVSTVDYYFGGNGLSKLKYEDDTYATPTLYFVKDNNKRTITGTVFEDKTTTDETTRIKTGNGKLDEDEVGVYGATVQLIELVDDGKVRLRYETTTKNDGKFEFSGFLPGNYIIRYHYGDTTNTVLLNQESHGINDKSYNGEDFQATNNGLNASEANKPNPSLNITQDYWYLHNENYGISTATDDTGRRTIVSKNVILFTDEQMTVFNNIRGGATDVENINDIIGETKMWANTNAMKFEVEKGTGSTASNGFEGYKITNMNFGIAEVPVTTVNLTKSLSKFTITDSTGQNVIASYESEKTKGYVTTADQAGGNYWVQIEDEKLQGARLEITYNINLNIVTEKNFDNTSPIVPTITGIVDFIDNNLSYNEMLGNNSENWEVTNYKETLNTLKGMRYKEGTEPTGTVDSEGTKYTTIVKATKDNPLLLTNTGEATATITLEKVLSSTNSTIEEIITSTVDSFEYSNIVEIIGFNYTNTTISNNENETTDTPSSNDNVMRDRVRTNDRYIILPGVQHDSATSETLVITPPTGDSSISITYYIIAVISLAILAVGAYGIKKYVIK